VDSLEVSLLSDSTHELVIVMYIISGVNYAVFQGNST
jgi:hypothetical protein